MVYKVRFEPPTNGLSPLQFCGPRIADFPRRVKSMPVQFMTEHREKTSVNLSSARFLVSAHFRRDWPAADAVEVAFAGRSNVGKSSAINVITNRRGLAKTSKTPGRTRQIVFFELDSGQRLVDLPGYGFAKVPLEVRRHWEKIITEYLASRPTLAGLILPVDSRRLLTPLDEQMLDWCQSASIRVHILLTKSDKLSRNQARQALFKVEEQLAGRTDVSVQLFSALKKAGLEEARNIIIALLTGKKNPGAYQAERMPGLE
jgi:GTP-binding protein